MKAMRILLRSLIYVLRWPMFERFPVISHESGFRHPLSDGLICPLTLLFLAASGVACKLVVPVVAAKSAVSRPHLGHPGSSFGRNGSWSLRKDEDVKHWRRQMS